MRDGDGVVRAAMNVTVHAAETSTERLVDDLLPMAVTALDSPGDGAERWEVVLAGSLEAVVVVVESRPSPETVHLTCQAARPGRVRTWHQLSLSTRPRADA